MYAAPNTAVTLFEAASIDTYSGERVSEVPIATGVPCHLIERPATRPRTGSEGRAVEDPASGTPRILRVFSARLPAGTVFNREGRIQDERTLRFFAVKAIRQHGNSVTGADLILELTASDPNDP